MDMLRLLGKLEDNSPDETKKSVEEVKLDLLYIHTQPSDRQKSQMIQIQNMSKDIWLDIGYLIRWNKKKSTFQFWEDLSKEELMFIIDQLRTRLVRYPSCANFDSIVMAMIHLRCKWPEHRRKELPYLLQCTKLWAKAFNDDYEGHFICGILQFVSAYEHENSSIAAETIKEAMTHLNKCTQICTQIQTTKSTSTLDFTLGKEKIWVVLFQGMYSKMNLVIWKNLKVVKLAKKPAQFELKISQNSG